MPATRSRGRTPAAASRPKASASGKQKRTATLNEVRAISEETRELLSAPKEYQDFVKALKSPHPDRDVIALLLKVAENTDGDWFEKAAALFRAANPGPSGQAGADPMEVDGDQEAAKNTGDEGMTVIVALNKLIATHC